MPLDARQVGERGPAQLDPSSPSGGRMNSDHRPRWRPARPGQRGQLEGSYIGAVTDPRGGEPAIFPASGTVNREDWGIVWNMPLPGGGLLVSKEIQLELERETTRQR
jgi:hypothetical protein